MSLWSRAKEAVNRARKIVAVLREEIPAAVEEARPVVAKRVRDRIKRASAILDDLAFRVLKTPQTPKKKPHKKAPKADFVVKRKKSAWRRLREIFLKGEEAEGGVGSAAASGMERVGLECLEETARRLIGDGFPFAVPDSKEYLDKTIDFELRIGLKPDVDITSQAWEVKEAFVPPPGFFISVGWRLPPTGFSAVDDTYIQLEGRGILGANFQSTVHSDENFLSARLNLSGLLEGRDDGEDGRFTHNARLPDEMFIRLHWSPRGKAPREE